MASLPSSLGLPFYLTQGACGGGKASQLWCDSFVTPRPLPPFPPCREELEIFAPGEEQRGGWGGGFCRSRCATLFFFCHSLSMAASQWWQEAKLCLHDTMSPTLNVGGTANPGQGLFLALLPTFTWQAVLLPFFAQCFYLLFCLTDTKYEERKKKKRQRNFASSYRAGLRKLKPKPIVSQLESTLLSVCGCFVHSVRWQVWTTKIGGKCKKDGISEQPFWSKARFLFSSLLLTLAPGLSHREMRHQKFRFTVKLKAKGGCNLSKISGDSTRVAGGHNVCACHTWLICLNREKDPWPSVSMSSSVTVSHSKFPLGNYT